MTVVEIRELEKEKGKALLGVSRVIKKIAAEQGPFRNVEEALGAGWIAKRRLDDDTTLMDGAFFDAVDFMRGYLLGDEKMQREFTPEKMLELVQHRSSACAFALCKLMVVLKRWEMMYDRSE